MKFLSLLSILLLSVGMAHSAPRPRAEDFILKPFLPQGAGKIAPCLTQVLETHLPDPYAKVKLWKGPGMKASGTGQVDTSSAAYIAEVTNSNVQYAILLYTVDSNGWRYVQYTEENQMKLGLVAASLYRYADIWEVTPRNGGSPSVKEVLKVDLMSCASVISRNK